MKRIIVYEARDYIEVGNGKKQLNEKQIILLNRVIKKQKLKSCYIQWEFNKFRFINYVGLITLKGVSIEVLPKTKELEESEARRALLNMLVKSRYLDVKYSDLSHTKLEDENLLEILAFLFSKKLKKELSRGIYREYINKNDNLNLVKGKIDIKGQIKNISRKRSKIACNYDEFSEDNLLNRIFYTMTYQLCREVKSLKTIDNLKIIMANYTDINMTRLNTTFINSIKFNRNNLRFRESYILLKKIYESLSSIGEDGRLEGFSFLFEVNELYEKYIGKVVKEVEHTTELQDKSKKLLVKKSTNNAVIQLKPDIVVPQKVIIDTKWKIIDKDKNRYGVAISDFYQMYAYLTRYEDIDKVILLYPLTDETMENGRVLKSFQMANNKDKSIDIVAIDIRDNKVTKEGIERLLGKELDYLFQLSSLLQEKDE